MVDIWPLGVAELAHVVIVEQYFPQRSRAWRYLIETVKRANKKLVANIKDNLASADTWRILRSATDEDTFKMDAKLRNTLAAGKDKIHMQRFLSADM